MDANLQNYCELFRKTCIKEECGAFTTSIPITEKQRQFLLAADIPVEGNIKEGMYCLKFQKILVASFRHNDKGDLVRVF